MIKKVGKIWWVDFMVGRKRLRISTKTSNRKLAEEIYTKLKYEAVEGLFFHRPPPHTLEELMAKAYPQGYGKAVLTYLGKDTLIHQVTPESIREKSNLVFPNRVGNLLDLREVGRRFRSACRKASVENFRFHDLRHTFASRLVQKGIDLYRIQKLLGHKNSSMTMRYSHLAVENLRDAVSVLTELPTPVNTG